MVSINMTSEQITFPLIHYNAYPQINAITFQPMNGVASPPMNINTSPSLSINASPPMNRDIFIINSPSCIKCNTFILNSEPCKSQLKQIKQRKAREKTKIDEKKFFNLCKSILKLKQD